MNQGDLYKSIGWKIAAQRRAIRLTQQQLADHIGMSRASIANIERGEQSIMIHMLFAIAECLKIDDVSDLLPKPNVNKDGQLRLTGSDDFTKAERDQIDEIVAALATSALKSDLEDNGHA